LAGVGGPHELRSEPSRDLPPCRHVRGQAPERGQARRLADRATHEIRARDQSQDRQSARTLDPEDASASSRPGVRVARSTSAANSRERRSDSPGAPCPPTTSPSRVCSWTDSWDLHRARERRRSAMRMYLALLLAAVFARSPLEGGAGEKQGQGVKELAGSWRGWVTEQTQERANMVVQTDGSYKASTTRGATTEGQFYLQDGKLRYRSSRTTGTARLSEDQGKTTLTVTSDNPDYGKAEYERIKQ